MFRSRTTALATAAVLAVPVVAVTAAPAQADVEKQRHFRVAGSLVDFQVEKDNGRFEVDVDIDDTARPGSRWKVVLRHDGKKVYSAVKRAQADGDVDLLDLKRRDTAGADRFKVTVKKVGGAKKSRTIRFGR